MYLTVLNDKEKKAFLNLASQIIDADQVVSNKELGMLNAMKIELQVNDFSPDEFGIVELCEQITNKQSQIATMIELIGLAYSDGTIADSEMDIIIKVANCFGISELQIDEYKEWVMKMLDLTNQGYCFFAEN